MRPEDLAALRRKYEEMLRLRLAHDAGDPEDPRRALRALASQFPGALRELDGLPLDVIQGRIAALAAAEAAGGAAPAPWMVAIDRFHVLTRGALCVKTWLAKRAATGVIDVLDGEAGRADVERTFAAAAGSLCWADDARAWAGDFARIVSPPRGRVTELVFARIAAELGCSTADVRHLVFGELRPRPLRKA